MTFIPPHEHFREVCVHGTVMAQCRCPSKDKVERTVACGDACLNAKPVLKEHEDRVEWTHGCDAICQNVRLWTPTARWCPHCGRPAPTPEEW